MKKTLLIGVLLLIVAAVAVAAVSTSPTSSKTGLSVAIGLKPALTVRCATDPSSGYDLPVPARVYLYDNTPEHDYIANKNTSVVNIGTQKYCQATFSSGIKKQQYFVVANSISALKVGKSTKYFGASASTPTLHEGSNIITLLLKPYDAPVIE